MHFRVCGGCLFFPPQPPIHPFFKQMIAKASAPLGKGVQTNLSTSSAASNKSQSPATKATRKEEQNPSQKAKLSQGQALAAKAPGITPHQESSSDSSSSDSSEEEAEALTTAKPPPPAPPGKRRTGSLGWVAGGRVSSETLEVWEPGEE